MRLISPLIRAGRLARGLRDLPIGVRTAAVFGVLLLCLVALGAHAILVMDSLSGGLINLTVRDLPKQQAVLAVKADAISTHVNVYRYVAWASSGVNAATLENLARTLHEQAQRPKAALAELVRRHDLSDADRAGLARAAAKWERYATAVANTVEIAETDPALGTLMLGGTDEDYLQVARDLDAIAARVSTGTTVAARTLVGDARWSKLLIGVGGVLAVVLGFGVTLIVIRSIVAPIQAITRTLRAEANEQSGGAVTATERGDEIAQLTRALATFRHQIAARNRLLAARKAELLLQNTRFNAALNNMSQGLAMFDADRRLIVCNPRYAEIYGVPMELMRPGTTQREILQHRVNSGVFAGPEADAYIEARIEVASAQRDSESILQLHDGRTIAVVHRAMPDGGWVSTHEDATERARAEQRIAHMARHDALTGLPNRLLFREEMERALAHAARGETIAVLCLDLDRFKEVNDTLGHPAGDQLLIEVAKRLRECVRKGDTIARLGGDEFAVIARSPACAEDAAATAQRIICALGMPYMLDGHEMLVGTSIGIAVAADEGAGADVLLRNADIALYRAKSDGRGAFRFFEAEMDMRLKARHKLEADLRRAVQNEEFELAYQPIVDLATGRTSAFEVLVRWRHAERGLVPPAEFIGPAEEMRLIGPIGDWVLREACVAAASWPEHIHLAVNLSPVQFRSGTLVRSIERAIAAAGLAAGRLELEITESVLLQENEATLATLHALRALGVRISLDDFGTGYSSLSYLLRFPVDRIKIDRTFVKDVALRDEAVAIVRAVVTLAASLGMATTAEGVETQEQLACLRAEGCTAAQGFLFSVPRGADELETYLAQRGEVGTRASTRVDGAVTREIALAS